MHELNEVPQTRLTAGNYYPGMTPDDHHRYIQLPIDHSDPSLGSFTDFYYLSPNFKAGADQDFGAQMGRWLAEAYPNSKLALFNDAHTITAYPDYYRGFRKTFFQTGLYSEETQAYFQDARQLNK
ncbi:MAG: hypothetical protein ABRQ26_10375 [Syntrophomonadaceae bacterium]